MNIEITNLSGANVIFVLIGAALFVRLVQSRRSIRRPPSSSERKGLRAILDSFL
jgi:hypothetical protein